MKWEESEQPLKCISCKSNMKKQISTGTDFKLKGPGWFKDGYTTKK